MRPSAPTLEDFDPTLIPFHMDVIKLVRRDWDYSRGPCEILLSGSIGSGKSLLLAHLVVTHALMNPGAGVMVGRRTLKDLKNTLWATILKHCEWLGAYYNRSDMKISLPNGSIIYATSWDDAGSVDKFRSYELSCAAVEELTENESPEFYEEIRMRIGRCPGVQENFMVSATNPGAPSSWAYKYFLDSDNPNRKVFYSKSAENPFLKPWYIQSLRETLDPKMARRMLEGEWLEIASEVIYYAFSEENVIKGYEVNPRYPIGMAYDFNIGDGKPMSCVIFQHIDKKFYFFKEYVIEGSRTLDILEEAYEDGLFNYPVPKFDIYGDASGKSRDTRSRKSDYSIIADFLSNVMAVGPDGREKRIVHEMKVPMSNPPIRTRHNFVNSQLKNSLGGVSLYIDERCKVLIEGMRLTAFKKGAAMIEDDSKRYQHSTTALGYAVVKILKSANVPEVTQRSY